MDRPCAFVSTDSEDEDEEEDAVVVTTTHKAMSDDEEEIDNSGTPNFLFHPSTSLFHPSIYIYGGGHKSALSLGQKRHSSPLIHTMIIF